MVLAWLGSLAAGELQVGMVLAVTGGGAAGYPGAGYGPPKRPPPGRLKVAFAGAYMDPSEIRQLWKKVTYKSEGTYKSTELQVGK